MRTNEEWLQHLQTIGELRENALVDLRDYLLRAVFLYLRDRRPDLSELDTNELYDLAEDFAQDALLSVRANLHNFRGESKFTTWAYRFVINHAADELRRKQYGHLSLEKLTEQETAVFHSLLSPQQYAEPDLASERQDMVRKLVDILQTHLNERQRLAILEVHFQERSMPEVAEELNISTNTLYKLLHDARKKLKAALAANHLSEGDIMAIFDAQ